MFLISAAQAAEEAAGHAAEPSFFGQGETWVAITWIIVVVLLAKPVFRGISAALDMRAEKIRARIEEAERLRAQAQELLASYQKKQRDALKEAEAIVAQAKAEADRIAAQAAIDLDELIKRREQQAVERIAQAEAEALREVRNTAVDIAINATRKLIVAHMGGDHASALIDAAIKDLPARLN
jgi:F-type H+-transporting ATPase subunit b